MADYDVGAVALVVPAPSSPLTTYRPAVSVRNNGIHDALASGYLRIYSAGLLVFESELYSATIQPGNTGTALAVDYWTPETIGTYTIHAHLSTPLDQVEPNNMLQPVTVEITAEAPPTPPAVPAHAAQHEDGAVDEISIDGLQGRTADPQTPLNHAAQHQAGGSDALNVGALQGILAQDQPAQVHSNTRHNPDMATAAELVAHQGSIAVHTAATNLANRETTGVDTGLVKGVQLAHALAVPRPGFQEMDQALVADRYFRPSVPVIHAFSHGLAADDPTAIGSSLGASDLLPPLGSDIARIDVPAAWLTPDLAIILYCTGQLILDASGLLTLQLFSGAASWLTITVPGISPNLRHFAITAHIIASPDGFYTGDLRYEDCLNASSSSRTFLESKLAPINMPSTDKVFKIRADITSPATGDMLSLKASFTRSLGSAPPLP